MAVEQIRYWSLSTLVYTSLGSITATLPTGLAAGDYALRLIASKAATGVPSVPTGWTSLGSWMSETGEPVGDDTGDVRLTVHGKVSDGTESGTTQAITLPGNMGAWTQSYRLRKSATNEGSPDYQWAVSAFFSQDLGWGPEVTAVFPSTSLVSTDFFVGAMAIPTDITTPAQFTNETVVAPGLTLGAAIEISEPDSATGNDIGGFVFRQGATAGSFTGTPEITATAAATNTNVYGPLTLIVLREEPVAAPPDAGPDQTGIEPWTTVTLTGTGTGTWSQTVGTAVTLNGTGDVRTFVAPGTWYGETLTFTFGDDPMNVTVLNATDFFISPVGDLTACYFDTV